MIFLHTLYVCFIVGPSHVHIARSDRPKFCKFNTTWLHISAQHLHHMKIHFLGSCQWMISASR